LDVLHQPGPILWSDFQIVAEHAGLAVQQEGAELGVSVQGLEQVVDELDQPDAEVLKVAHHSRSQCVWWKV
jgi:hypothetical protein